jgi:octaprenyl-diphosphate synthase
MSVPILRQADEARRRLADIYAPIADDLAEAERIFAAELKSRSGFVQLLVEHSADFRGKRLRPALVLLIGRACGRVSHAHRVLAAVVEMIHTATLVHDDILDEAMVRRHAATINAEWGNEPAVLLGDYLFSHAYHLAASLETTLACRWIGRATNLVCEGEMQQVHNRGNLDLDEATYIEIVRGKTAELTAICGRLGAHYAGAGADVEDAMETYGRDLGVAFQIADDVLDLWGEERTAGKTLGTDLDKQKLTLPLIRFLATAPDDTARRVRGWLAEPHPDRERLRPLLLASGALEYAWEVARRHAVAAEAALDAVAPSPSREVLTVLARSVVNRPF